MTDDKTKTDVGAYVQGAVWESKPVAYPAVFEQSSDGVYVFFPDIPGCTTAGETLEEAFIRAGEIGSIVLEELAKSKEPIPVPRTLAEVRKEIEADAEINALHIGLVAVMVSEAKNESN